MLFPGLRMGQAFDTLLEMVPKSVMNYCNYNTRETLKSVHCDLSVGESRITFLLKHSTFEGKAGGHNLPVIPTTLDVTVL